MSAQGLLNRIVKPEAGWYRGNFHSHTTFSSDGHHSPAQLLQTARAEGLDFFAVTDHNSIDAYAEFKDNSDLLVIPGLEVTLTDGHFNVFGLPGWLDWMEHICTGGSVIRLNGNYRSPNDLIRRIAGHGLLSSINHPRRGECDWRDGTTELRHLDCVEIWNKPGDFQNRQANPAAITMWTAWLNEGYRTTAIGGSDFHGTPGERLGLPSTYVYGRELSVTGILEGLRQRRVYVSMGPEVTFQAQANGEPYDMGADLGQIEASLSLSATVSASPTAGCARIVKNGQVIAEAPVNGRQTSLQARDNTEPDRPAWYRLDVMDEAGQLLAITNPFFTGPQREPELQTFGDFDTI